MSVTSAVSVLVLLISQAASNGYASPPTESTGLFVLWASANLPLFALVIAATLVIGFTFERFAAAALLFSTALPAAAVVVVLTGTLASGDGGVVVLSPALRSSLTGLAGVTAWNAIARVMLLPVPRSASSRHWSLHVSALTVWLWVAGCLCPLLSHFVDIRVELYLNPIAIVFLWVCIAIVVAPLMGYKVLPLSDFIQTLMMPLSYEYATAETVRREGSVHCRVKQFSQLLGMRQVLWALLWAHALHTAVDVWQLSELVCLLDTAAEQGVILSTESLPGTSRYAIDGFFACWERSDANTLGTHWVDVLSLCTLSAYFFATVAAVTAYIITSVVQTSTEQASEQQQTSAMLRWLSHECRSPIGIALLAIENATQEPLLALRRKAAAEMAATSHETAMPPSNTELLSRSLRARNVSQDSASASAVGLLAPIAADHTSATNPSSASLVHVDSGGFVARQHSPVHSAGGSAGSGDSTSTAATPAQGPQAKTHQAAAPEMDSKQGRADGGRFRIASRTLVTGEGGGNPTGRPPPSRVPKAPADTVRSGDLSAREDVRLPRGSSASDALDSLWSVYRALDEDLQSILQPLSMMGGVLDNMLVYLKSRDDKRDADFGEAEEDARDDEWGPSGRTTGGASGRSISSVGGAGGRQRAVRLNVQHSLLDLEQMMQHLVDLYDVPPPRLKRTFVFQLDGKATRLQGAASLEVLLEHGLWVYAGVAPPTLKQALVNLFTNALKYGATVGEEGVGGAPSTMASRGYSTLAMSTILQDQGGLVQGAGGGVSGRSGSSDGRPQAHIGVHLALSLRSDVLPSARLLMPEDSAYLSVAAGSLQLTVSDHGQGLNADELLGLFEPFSRLRSGTQQKGTGLGLWLMRELLQSQGGELTAESAGHGRGSKFTITIPVATHVQHARSLLALSQPEQNVVQALRNPGGYEMFRVVTLLEGDLSDSDSDSEDEGGLHGSRSGFESGGDGGSAHGSTAPEKSKASLHANLGTALPVLVPSASGRGQRALSGGSDGSALVTGSGAQWRTSMTMSRATSGVGDSVPSGRGAEGGSNDPGLAREPPSPLGRAGGPTRSSLGAIGEHSVESGTATPQADGQRSPPLGSVGSRTPPTSSLGGAHSSSLRGGSRMSRRGSSSMGSASSGAGAGLHVLVVDDSAPLRKQLTRTLKRQGCTITGAEDGKDALLKIAQATKQIHVVLCDLSMPVMSGPQFAAALKRVGALRCMAAKVPHAAPTATVPTLAPILASIGALHSGAKPTPAVQGGGGGGPATGSRNASGQSGMSSDSPDEHGGPMGGLESLLSEEPLLAAGDSRDASIGPPGTRLTAASGVTTVQPVSLQASSHDSGPLAERERELSRASDVHISRRHSAGGGGGAAAPRRGNTSTAQLGVTPLDLMKGGSNIESRGASGIAGSILLSTSGNDAMGETNSLVGRMSREASVSAASAVGGGRGREGGGLEELSALFEGVAFLGLTGNGIQSDLDAFRRAGAHVVLTKPCTAPVIIATACAVLQAIHQETIAGLAQGVRDA